jgi:deoxyadenosine/deoxycytidine kinase
MLTTIKKKMGSQQILDHLLRSSIYFMGQLLYHMPSKLIVLTGTTCTGKSSLAKSIISADPEILHIDMDDFIKQSFFSYTEKLAQNESGHSPRIAQLLSLLGNRLLFYSCMSQGKDIFYKLTIDEPLKVVLDELKQWLDSDPQFQKRLYRHITRELHQCLKKWMLLGKVVILDLASNARDLAHLSSFKPTFVLCHCDMNTLFDRLVTRNQQAIAQKQEKNYRLVTNLVHQIGIFFQTKTRSEHHYPTFMSIDHKSFQQRYEALLSEQSRAGFPPTNQPPSLTFFHTTSDKLTVREAFHYSIQTANTFKQQKTQLEHILRAPRDRKSSYRPISPCLLVMDGMSMSGKTTIASALARQNHNVEIVYRSEEQRRLLLEGSKCLREQHKQYPFIISDSRNVKYPAYRECFPRVTHYPKELLYSVQQHCEEQSKAIFKQESIIAAKKATAAIESGLCVIFDNLIYKQLSEHLQPLLPTIILVYCPPEDILNHAISRTRYATTRKSSNYWRDPYKVIETFSIFYGTKNSHQNPSVDTLERKVFLALLEKLYQHFPAEQYNRTEEVFTELMLAKLGLDRQEQVELFPQLNHPDLILHTQRSPDENAALIVEFLNQPENHYATNIRP